MWCVGGVCYLMWNSFIEVLEIGSMFFGVKIFCFLEGCF